MIYSNNKPQLILLNNVRKSVRTKALTGNTFTGERTIVINVLAITLK